MHSEGLGFRFLGFRVDSSCRAQATLRQSYLTAMAATITSLKLCAGKIYTGSSKPYLIPCIIYLYITGILSLGSPDDLPRASEGSVSSFSSHG